MNRSSPIQFRTLFASIVLALCLSCSASPPAHKSFTVLVPVPASGSVDGVVVYGANQSDTNWTRLVSSPATNGQQIVVSVPARELYTATTTFDGSEGDYGPAVATPPTVNAKIK